MSRWPLPLRLFELSDVVLLDPSRGVGARNERPGTTGISHLFEHMMFNGAKKYGPGQFDRVLELGGVQPTGRGT